MNEQQEDNYVLIYPEHFSFIEAQKRTKVLSDSLVKASMDTKAIELVYGLITKAGLHLVWHVKTNFGAFKVVEHSNGQYTLERFLYDIPSDQFVSNKKHFIAINSNQDDLVKKLIILKKKMLKK